MSAVARAASRLLPATSLVRRYRRDWLRGDVLAGLTVAAYLVPQVMAYAGVAGLPPVAGLWAAVPSLAGYALLGSSRQLSVGPESTTALMSAAAIAPLARGDAGRYAVLMAALALLVGLVCLLAWVARLGFVADLLSRPVLVGYLAGVAVTMVVSQLQRTTGVPADGGRLPAQLLWFLRRLGQVHWPTLLATLLVLTFLWTVQARAPHLPGPLLAVAGAAAVVAALGLQRHGLAVVGSVPAGLPRPELPGLSRADLTALLLPAVGITVVGYTDTVLTARAFAERNGYRLDHNRELLALGTVNLGAGVLHGFPVSSSASRTALGDAAGSRTQLYSLVALLSLLAVLLAGGPLLAQFPQAALGAVIVYAAARLVDLPEFRRIARFRRSELVLSLATFVGVLALDILYGVLLAIAVSVADLLRRVARPHDAILGQVAGLAGMHDVDDYPSARTIPGLVVYRYDSPLFFANAEDFKRRALAAADAAEELAWFVLNAESNVEVDITGLDAVEWLRAELQGRGVVFALARVKQDLLDDLRSHGLAAAIGAARLYPTMPTAVAAYRAWCAENRHDLGD